MTTCLNCENIFEGNYCNQCGQKASTHRLALHDIWHDLQHSLFHLDKGILYNFRTLWRPKLALDYIKGKRIHFYNPILYVLIILGIITYLENEFFKGKLLPVQSGKELGELGSKIIYQMSYWMTHYFKYMKLVILIPIALFSNIIFRKSHQFRFIENLYLAAFITANAAIISMISLPISYFLDNIIYSRLLSFLMMFIYIWTVYSTSNKIRSFFKSVLVLFLSMILTTSFFLLLTIITIKIIN